MFDKEQYEKDLIARHKKCPYCGGFKRIEVYKDEEEEDEDYPYRGYETPIERIYVPCPHCTKQNP